MRASSVFLKYATNNDSAARGFDIKSYLQGLVDTVVKTALLTALGGGSSRRWKVGYWTARKANNCVSSLTHACTFL